MKKIRVIELFAGIGACSKALTRLGIEHDIVDAVEIDKYAVASFNAIHNTNFETQDITKWDKDLQDIDLIMHGSPCQDFSIAGKQAGGDVDSGTRSSLMYETVRIVGKIRPKYIVWENVKNILSAKHKHNFEKYIDTLNTLGYNSYYQVLNAKDYGIPQNRERIFTISIRKDIDTNNFVFPKKEELKLRLKDMLEDEVDRKYYLSEEMINKIRTSNFTQERLRIQEKDYCDALLARDYKDPKCIEVKRKYGIFDTEKAKHQAGSIYDQNGIAPTIDTMQGGWRQPCIEVKEATKKGYQDAYNGDSINLAYPESKTRRGRVGNQVSQTLTTSDNMSVVVNDLYEEQEYQEYLEHLKEFERNGFKKEYPELGITIRKLTPKECWRLMGFDDEDFEKAATVNSNTQLYKQAGNSIVVNVLEKIFKNLFKEELNETDR